MGSYGTVQRPNTISSTSASMVEPHESKEDSAGKKRYDFQRPEFTLVCPLNIPSTPEAAALRIIKNLAHFALFYTHFVWLVLFITLIPKRKVSLIYLVIMTYVASLYLLILRALPTSYLLHKIIDKRLVLGLIVSVTMVELILTDAAIHLFVSLAATIPIVLVHAVLWVREDLSVDDREETGTTVAGELLPLVCKSTDEETSSVV